MNSYRIVKRKSPEPKGHYYLIKDLKNNDQYAFSSFEPAYNKLIDLRKEEFLKIKKKCRLIVAGGRDITSSEMVSRSIQESGWLSRVTELVHGNCRGIDTLAEDFFKENFPFIKIKKEEAEWEKYRREGNVKMAGPMRNRKMAEYAAEHDGRLILIWNGKSHGSASMLKEAEDAGLKIFQHII